MTTLALSPSTGPQPGSRGPALGLGISLLVHAAVLAWLMHAPAPRSPDTAPVARMTVWLAPPRPAQPLAPKATPKPAEPAAAHAAAPRPSAPPHRPRPERRPRADAPAPARASETPPILSAPPAASRDVFAVPPAPATPAAGTDAGPVVDLAAARAAAREIAREDGKSLVALPARKPVVDPNSGRPQPIDPIEAARRHDCRTAYAGLGLLAVIPLVASAVTDTGCKW